MKRSHSIMIERNVHFISFLIIKSASRIFRYNSGHRRNRNLSPRSCIETSTNPGSPHLRVHALSSSSFSRRAIGRSFRCEKLRSPERCQLKLEGGKKSGERVRYNAEDIKASFLANIFSDEQQMMNKGKEEY